MCLICIEPIQQLLNSPELIYNYQKVLSALIELKLFQNESLPSLGTWEETWNVHNASRTTQAKPLIVLPVATR